MKPATKLLFEREVKKGVVGGLFALLLGFVWKENKKIDERIDADYAVRIENAKRNPETNP